MKDFRHSIYLLLVWLIIFANPLASISAKEIYDTELMKKNNIESGLGSEFTSIESLINDLINKHQVDRDIIGLAYYNFTTGEHYYINEDKYFIGASTSKVAVAMRYFDLIDEGELSLNSSIPFKSSYYEKGAGYIANSPIKDSYPLEDLISNMIIYSDNTAWSGLKQNYKTYGDLNKDILKQLDFSSVPNYYYSDNYSCAKLAETWLIHIAQDKKYADLIKYMSETEPDQLFTSYVKEGMANKFGRLNNLVHDTGIYFENKSPQYALVCYTEGLKGSDLFLEELNLRINEYYRAMYIESDLKKLDPSQNEGIKVGIKVEPIKE